jgi:hypothetical protein
MEISLFSILGLLAFIFNALAAPTVVASNDIEDIQTFSTLFLRGKILWTLVANTGKYMDLIKALWIIFPPSRRLQRTKMHLQFALNMLIA